MEFRKENKKVIDAGLKHIGFSFLAFVLSGGSILGTFSPFGVAFLAVLPLEYALTSLIGCIAGYLFFGGIGKSVVYLFALVLLMGMKVAVTSKRKLAKNYGFCAVAVFLALTLIHLVLFFVMEQTTANLVLGLCEAVLGGSMVLFMGISTNLILRGKAIYDFDPLEQASMAICGMMFLTALAGLEIAGFNLGRITGAFFVLVWI